MGGATRPPPLDMRISPASINTVEKFVASRTLKEPLEWQNSRLIEGPLEGFVAGLKQRDGGEIAVMGSISVVRQLLFAGLLDAADADDAPRGGRQRAASVRSR